jgi:hypothetical protein
MSFKKYLQETAVAGSTSAGSIASNASGDSRKEHKRGESVWRENAPKERDDEAKYARMRSEIAKAKELKKKKKPSFKDFIMRRKVNEDFDMDDIVSRLKGSDVESSGEDVGVVSYGVEDDKGNVMRITVRADQAKEFEETIAKQLADNKDNKSNGISLKGNSLAEILYNLRDQFEIITVDFPIIPKDVVYNADQASKTPENDFATDDDAMSGDAGMEGGDDGFDQSFDDFGGGAQGPDAGMGDDMNPDASTDPNAAPTGDEPGMEGGLDDMNPDDGSDPNAEGDNVEDFGADDAGDEGDEGSILKQIVSMLKAQAKASEATADAAAEEARAKQAEWSAIASEREVKRQEDLARVEAQIQANKKKEKEAKKYAELARYNVTQASGASNSQANESRKTFLTGAIQLLKEDNFDNVQALTKEKLQLQVKYKVNPADDQATQAYKKAMFNLETAELNARIKQVQITQQYNSDEAKNNPQTNQQQNQQNQQNNQQQNNQQQNGPQQPSNTTPQVPNGPAPNSGIN